MVGFQHTTVTYTTGSGRYRALGRDDLQARVLSCCRSTPRDLGRARTASTPAEAREQTHSVRAPCSVDLHDQRRASVQVAAAMRSSIDPLTTKRRLSRRLLQPVWARFSPRPRFGWRRDIDRALAAGRRRYGAGANAANSRLLPISPSSGSAARDNPLMRLDPSIFTSTMRLVAALAAGRELAMLITPASV